MERRFGRLHRAGQQQELSLGAIVAAQVQAPLIADADLTAVAANSSCGGRGVGCRRCATAIANASRGLRFFQHVQKSEHAIHDHAIHVG